MNLSDICEKIESHPLLLTIMGTFFGMLLYSLYSGIRSYLKKDNFFQGFIKIFKLIINFVKWIFTLQKQLIILILKPLVRPIIYEIIFESELNENKYKKVENEIINLNKTKNDDCFYHNFLKLDDSIHRFKLKKIDGEHWRIGFKLSKIQNFNKVRLVRDYPLIHLAKNKKENFLRVFEYDAQNKLLVKGGCTIDEKYNNDPVTIILKKESNVIFLKILVKNRIIYSQDYNYGEYIYSRLFAWGDGHSYKFKVQIEKFSKPN